MRGKTDKTKNGGKWILEHWAEVEKVMAKNSIRHTAEVLNLSLPALWHVIREKRKAEGITRERYKGCDRDCFNCTYSDCLAGTNMSTGAGHRGSGAVECTPERIGRPEVNPFTAAVEASLWAHKHGIVRDELIYEGEGW